MSGFAWSRFRFSFSPRRGALVLAAALVIGASLDPASALSSGPASSAAAPDSAAAPPQNLTVTTSMGQLEGRTTGDADQFLGIPYAQPPVGALRWQPPAAVVPWTGIRSAFAYGNRCSQSASGNGPRIDTEDCLYLNVFTPARIPAAGKLPVLVMIHGGGLTTGAGDQQDGSLLAQTENVVVVSLNYRLGPLGYFSVPGLTDPSASSGDFGLLDQEAALRWVTTEIAAFGGDPSRIAVAGESAGGFSVCALLAAPAARGLFSRAIVQSGGCPSETTAQAQTAGTAFAAKLGCTDPASVATCLRAKPESALIDASATYQTSLIHGGPELPIAPAQAIATGHYTKVPLLIGANRDEGRTFAGGFASFTEQQYTAFVTSSYGSLAPQILQRYPWSVYPSPYTAAYAIAAIWTDSGAIGGIGGCATARLAGQFRTRTPTFMYEFDDRNAPGLNNQTPGYNWGAGHAMELAYLWPSFTNGSSLYARFTPAQLELSRQMLARWAAFARTADPNTRGWIDWPSNTAGKMLSLRPGDDTRVISSSAFAAEHQCAFWDRAGAGTAGQAVALP